MPRGLGFFPDAVVIRSGPPLAPAPLYGDGDSNEYGLEARENAVYRGRRPEAAAHIYYPESGPDASGPDASGPSTSGASGPSRPPQPPGPLLPGAAPQGADAWPLWKDWNTNPSGHGGAKRGPPVFVKAQGYDLEATEVGAVVEEALPPPVPLADVVDEDKDDGAGVANWYLSLLGGRKEDKVEAQARPSTPQSVSAAMSSQTTRGGTTSVGTTSAGTSPAPSAEPTPAPPAPLVRVPASEWFIRRALVNKAPLPQRSSTPASSIASLLGPAAGAGADGTAPAPPPRFHYALGPENAGYARLAALGWAGGGLGRPEGWTGDVFERPSPSPSTRPGSASAGPSRQRSPGRSRSLEGSSGVIDLTADSDSDPDSDADTYSPAADPEAELEDETTAATAVHGPGRTAPIATALKLDRRGLGLGRTGGASSKRVTHSAAEIERARRRARGARETHPEEREKKVKVKWAERDRRDRELRNRIAAFLGS